MQQRVTVKYVSFSHSLLKSQEDTLFFISYAIEYNIFLASYGQRRENVFVHQFVPVRRRPVEGTEDHVVMRCVMSPALKVTEKSSLCWWVRKKMFI